MTELTFGTLAKLLRIIVPCLLLGACSGLAPRQDADSREVLAGILEQGVVSFAARPQLPLPDDLHRLDPQQLADFRAYLDDPVRRQLPMHQRVYDYLEKITSQFAYYEQTLPASAALHQLSGNCMSLAVLTTALAEAAGVDIGYRLMEDVPVFEYQGNTVIKGVHLSTILFRDNWMTQSSDWRATSRPGLQVDYFRSSRTTLRANTDRNEYLAMYYQNIAAESLAEGRLDNAYWHAVEALQYSPLHAPAINSLAVLFRRKGDLAGAESLYKFGIERSRDTLVLMRNYQALLVYMGRDAEARKIDRQLARKDETSPFRWITLAYEAESQQDYQSAIDYYGRALQQAPYMHEVQLSIALANLRAGRLSRAGKALEKAIALVPAPATRSLYEKKMELLNQALHN